MQCRACSALLTEHDEAQRAYVEAPDLLARRYPDTRTAEYKKLRDAADQAKVRFDAAKLKMEKHRENHQIV